MSREESTIAKKFNENIAIIQFQNLPFLEVYKRLKMYLVIKRYFLFQLHHKDKQSNRMQIVADGIVAGAVGAPKRSYMPP